MISSTLELIRQKLTGALCPAHLEIVDESHLHAGHAGARSGGGHYAVTIVSAAFEGLARTQRHRLVYAALGDEMRRGIHALALSTMTPSEWLTGSSGPSTAPQRM